MNESIIKFTEFSKDPNNYGLIHANLKVPYTQYSTLIIDSLTTNACFEVLNADDFLILKKNEEEIKIQFEESYSNIDSESLAELIHDKLVDEGIDCSVDLTNRFKFKASEKLYLFDASYNLKLLLGIYDQTLPIESDENGEIHCLSVGHYLSTPILYLIASIGGKCFVKDGNGYSNQRVSMRINNSFSANFPVIANNVEFKVYTLSNDLSNIDFELVDAHFKKVKLLTPLYLCGTITGDVNAETIFTGMIPPELIEEPKKISDK